MRREQLCTTLAVLVALGWTLAFHAAIAGGNAGGAGNAFCRVGQSCTMGPITAPALNAVQIDAGLFNVRQLNATVGIDTVRMDAGNVSVRQLNAMVGIDAVVMDAGSINVRQLNAQVGLDAVQVDAGLVNVRQLNAAVGIDTVTIDAGTVRALLVNANAVDAGNATFWGTQFGVGGPADLGVSVENFLRVQGGSTGTDVRVQALGSDSTISISLEPKGSGGVILGAGSSKISKSLRCTDTIDFASTNVDNCTDATIACSGAATNAECVVGIPAAAAVTGADFWCFVSSADNVKLRLCCDKEASSCDPASASYSVRVFNP